MKELQMEQNDTITQMQYNNDTITQMQYNRWVRKMNRNKTGTSWIYLRCTDPDEYIKTKLYKDEEDKLYWVLAKCGERMYLKVAPPDEFPLILPLIIHNKNGD